MIDIIIASVVIALVLIAFLPPPDDWPDDH